MGRPANLCVCVCVFFYPEFHAEISELDANTLETVAQYPDQAQAQDRGTQTRVPWMTPGENRHEALRGVLREIVASEGNRRVSVGSEIYVPHYAWCGILCSMLC
jgi:hypothetical protein